MKNLNRMVRARMEAEKNSRARDEQPERKAEGEESQAEGVEAKPEPEREEDQSTEGPTGAEEQKEAPEEGIEEDATGAEEEERRKSGGQQKYVRPKAAPTIYADVDVCRLLRRNRRSLMKARRMKGRGVDWDCIGYHAGMTEGWILREKPDAEIERIRKWAIQPEDGVATVEVVQHVRDIQKLACRRLADGEVVVVAVRDASEFLDGEQMDVEIVNGKYRYSARLNEV